MIYKKAIVVAIAAAAFLANSSLALASGSSYGTSNCQVIYGGGEVCPTSLKFTIDKQVQSPTKGGTFVDNLGFNDVKFAPGTQVTFKIILQNTGDNDINQLVVTDSLPDFLTFTSGVGNFNSANKTVTYTINNLPKGQQNEQTITATISNSDQLPNEAVTCLTNKVSATDNNGSTAVDNASFCVEKEVINAVPKGGPQIQKSFPPKTIPNTGPEMLPILGLIPAGISGYFLRKKSKLS